MPPIELSDGKKVESGYEKAHPPGISDGMKNNVVSLRNGANDDSLKKGKKQRVSPDEEYLL